MQASTALYKTTIAGSAMTVAYQVTWTLPTSAGLSRNNLCVDPSFEGTTTPWYPGGTDLQPTLRLSSARAFSGTQSLLVTWTTTTAATLPGPYLNLPTLPGAAYTISAYVFVATSSPAVQLVTSVTSGSASTLTNQWQRISVTFNANLTNHIIAVCPTTNPTTGQTVNVDAVLIEQTGTVGSYFDGGTASAFWTGDPNRSTSTLNVNPYQDVSLAVESLSVDRQLTTDMPDGTRLITGYPAASATVTLSGLVDQTPGASKSIAWLLNPAEPTSPMYRSDALGSPVTVKAGIYTPGVATPEIYTVFVGTVDDYTVDVQAGTVTLTCLDYRSLFTNAPPLPLGAFSSGPNPQLLTSGWVFNQLAESIGRYTSPPARDLCVYRQTNHGGVWPELGFTAAASIGSINPAYTVGKYSQQVPVNAFVSYANAPTSGYANGSLRGDIGSSGSPWFVECWIQATTDSGIITPLAALELNMNGAIGGQTIELFMGCAASSLGSALTPYAEVLTAPGPVITKVTAPSLTIPNDGAWHYFAVAFRFTSSTSFVATFYVDGSIQSANGFPATAVQANCTMSSVSLTENCPMESVQITNEGGQPLANNGWTPSALVDIDASLNNLTAVPDTTGLDTWTLIQQLAEAEGGIAGFNELGVFTFANRDTLRAQTSQRTITPTYSLKTLRQEMGMSFVRNHIQIPVNNLEVQPFGAVWSASSVIGIHSRSTYSTVVTTTSPVVQVALTTTVIPNGGLTAGLSGYRASRQPDGTGGQVSNLIMTVEQLGPSSLAVTVTNPNGFPVYLASPSGAGYPSTSNGQPALSVGGRFVTASGTATDTGTATSGTVLADAQWPPADSGGAVMNPRGEQLLTVTSNLWLQDTDTAQLLADYLLTDLTYPRPLWRDTQIVADPTLQLAGLVTVADPDTTKITGAALIIGVHTTMSATDWTQTLDLRATGAPGSWILGVPGSSEMSVTTYL